MIKLVLSGIKRQLGDTPDQKIPLTPAQLMLIQQYLDMSDPTVRALWCGIVLSFRTLLRKSNIVPDSSTSDNHVLLRENVTFTDTGMILVVKSSKTLQYSERVLEIPLNFIPGSPLCVVTLLKNHFRDVPMPSESYLLYKSSSSSPTPVLYRDLLEFLKGCVMNIGLNPNDVGLHSLRRAGTAFLHSINIPLEDIRCIGDWKSLAVLSYLVTPMDRKLMLEKRVSDALAGL